MIYAGGGGGGGSGVVGGLNGGNGGYISYYSIHLCYSFMTLCWEILQVHCGLNTKCVFYTSSINFIVIQSF